MFHEETLEHRSVQIKYLLMFLFSECKKGYIYVRFYIIRYSHSKSQSQ